MLKIPRLKIPRLKIPRLKIPRLKFSLSYIHYLSHYLNKYHHLM